jgi:hypothetical protein
MSEEGCPPSWNTLDTSPPVLHTHRSLIGRHPGGLVWTCTHPACYAPLAQPECKVCRPGFHPRLTFTSRKMRR